MKTLNKNEELIENEAQLTNYFKSGCKSTESIGLEYEKIPICTEDFKATEFFFKNGILDFLTTYKNEHACIPIYEDDILLGLITNSGTITLEPGSQVEASFNPIENIADIELQLNKYNQYTKQIAEKLGIKFISLGLQPISTFKNIKIIPKKRYSFMTKFLKEQATLPYVMMRETAGIQVSIDYKSEEDAIKKLSTALKLSPFISTFFSNSPIRNGKLTGYKSFRAYSWLNTDNKRCGLISKKLFEKNMDFTFDDYAKILLDVPMIFNRDNYIGDTTFRQFMQSNSIFQNDWLTHLSLFFPDVRLKNYIEIRNHDCQNINLALAIPTLYKGIMYSKNGIEKVNQLLSKFDYYDFEFVRHNGCRFGMNFAVKNIKISDIIKDIFAISQEGLQEQNTKEEHYLESAMEILDNNLTPADIIIKNFEGSWHKDISQLVKYFEIK